MGHSFTSFHGKHIQSRDYKIETWLFLIVKEIDVLIDKEPWLLEARNYWEDQAVISINGCIDPDLDHFLIDEHRVKVFRDICQKINLELLKHGEKISKDYLNELCRYKPPYDVKGDNETELYLSFGKALLELLDGNQNEEVKNA